MKTIKYLSSFFLIALMVFGCEKDENVDFVKNVAAPTNISAGVNIIPDNSGLTKITPTGDGVASYIVDFGDGSEPSEALAPGEYAEHMYAEGTYEAIITATGINGKKATGTQTVNVSFRAPENLEIATTISPNNAFILNVSASADFASSFIVFFDTTNPDEEGTPLELGGTVSNEYPAVGDYTIKVVALSGGVESIEMEQMVTIDQPTEFPIDFEVFDAANFIGFGGASAEVVGNPQIDAGNSSFTVGKIIKDAPEVWAGNVITMSSVIDFSSRNQITMKAWSPRPGGTLTMKIENLDDADIFIEKVATLKGNSDWEEVSFDFSDADLSIEYQKVVFFFDFGTVGAGGPDWTFYVDDITQSTPSSGGGPLIYDDFEGNGNITTWAGDAAGMDNEFANPFVDGINESATVLQYDDTGEQYANVRFDTPSNFDLKAGGSKFSLKIYVPSSSISGDQPNQISLKLQDGTANEPWALQTEIIKPIVLDAWQTITFDFATDATAGADDPLDRTDFNRVVLQVNSENNTDTVTAYIDDFEYGESGFVDTEPFARDDFEGNGTISTWAGDAAGMDNAFANPYVDAINESATVLQYDDTGEQYANVRFDVEPNFDMTAKSKFSLKIYVPSSSISGDQPNQISLKLQDGTANEPWALQTEIIKPIVLDAWQTISFDFANDTTAGADDPLDRTDFNRVVLQVNSENNTDTVIAYIDDFVYFN